MCKCPTWTDWRRRWPSVLEERSTGGHVPIVAMTARALKGDREQCLAVGMDGYVAKPLQPQELFDTVERLATTRQHDPATPAPSPALASGESQPTSQLASPVRPPPDSPVDFDRTQALEQVGGDEGILQELIAAFFAEYPQLMAEIRDAVAQCDARRLGFATHTLKGAAQTLAAPAVSAAAERLETMGWNGNLAEAASVAAELDDALRRLGTALRAVQARP